jgi:hypothetical protein
MEISTTIVATSTALINKAPVIINRVQTRAGIAIRQTGTTAGASLVGTVGDPTQSVCVETRIIQKTCIGKGVTNKASFRRDN